MKGKMGDGKSTGSRKEMGGQMGEGKATGSRKEMEGKIGDGKDRGREVFTYSRALCRARRIS